MQHGGMALNKMANNKNTDEEIEEMKTNEQTNASMLQLKIYI